MRIQDRTKDVIKSGGEFLSSVALEGAAMGHPKVWASVVCLLHKQQQQGGSVALELGQKKRGEEGAVVCIAPA
jgi:acyl-CoA synthetase (AMP-forming)/AMP-acid ligase II